MTNATSKDGLDRLHEAMAARVAKGEMPGMVTLIAHGDDVASPALAQKPGAHIVGDLPHRRGPLHVVGAAVQTSAGCRSRVRIGKGITIPSVL